jgi:hypothetical protein
VSGSCGLGEYDALDTAFTAITRFFGKKKEAVTPFDILSCFLMASVLCAEACSVPFTIDPKSKLPRHMSPRFCELSHAMGVNVLAPLLENHVHTLGGWENVISTFPSSSNNDESPGGYRWVLLVTLRRTLLELLGYILVGDFLLRP